MGVKVKNVERLLKKLNNLRDMNLKDAITDCTLIVEAQAKALCPSDTGALRESIHPEVKNKDNKIYGRVYTNAGHAAYVEFGTGPKGNGTYPYTIKGLSLKYRDTKWCYTKDDGKTFIWTKGQVAQPYMYPALEMNKEQIKSKLKNAVSGYASKIVGGGK